MSHLIAHFELRDVKDMISCRSTKQMTLSIVDFANIRRNKVAHFMEPDFEMTKSLSPLIALNSLKSLPYHLYILVTAS